MILDFCEIPFQIKFFDTKHRKSLHVDVGTEFGAGGAFDDSPTSCSAAAAAGGGTASTTGAAIVLGLSLGFLDIAIIRLGILHL